MSEDNEEIPLRGGRTTKGIVRIGHTVHRPVTANSALVRRLLEHLKIKGFEGAPTLLGIDEYGRDVLSFIEGDVPTDLGFYNNEALRNAAVLIRHYHDLTGESAAAFGAHAVSPDVICHNDLSPCDFVFRAGQPIAIIDFDAAAPGPRIHDLGYAAWLWLDLGSADINVAQQRRRLNLFVEAYGMSDAGSVLPAVIERQQMLVAQGKRQANAGMASWAAGCLEWTEHHYEDLRTG